MTLTESPVRRETGERMPDGALNTGVERVSSKIMPQVLADVAQAAPLAVLDLGFGMPETVAYFNDPERRCRLHFAGLQELLEAGTPLPDGLSAEEHWHRTFRSLLEEFQQARFDLLFFWDYLNLLDEPAVQGLSRALKPYVDERSRGHGFLAPNSAVSVPGRRYSLLADDCIAMRPGKSTGTQIWHRPHGRLARLLDAMTIGHSVLRHGGMLELSFKGVG